MVSEAALPLDKGLDRAHDDNVMTRKLKVMMAAIILKDRDRDRGLAPERNMSAAGNGGRPDAVCM